MSRRKLRILHSSDLHGHWEAPIKYPDQSWDIWIDTGDYLPNATRGEVQKELAYQKGWMTMDKLAFRKWGQALLERHYGSREEALRWLPTASRLPPFTGSVAKSVTTWLAGRPMLCVPGNHDYYSLADALKKEGAQAADLTKGYAEVGGLKFAGIRSIPWLEGEWAGETKEEDFRDIVEQLMGSEPDVLLTHSPPYGILDYAIGKGGHAGIQALTQWLTYRPHAVKAVLCGHVHESAGKLEEMDILFSNAATTVQMLEVEV
jgi:Icc-related predicted phosphoesterase